MFGRMSTHNKVWPDITLIVQIYILMLDLG